MPSNVDSQTYKSLVQEKADLIAEAQAMFNAAGERDDKAHMRPTTSKNRKSWLLKPGSAMWKFCPIGPCGSNCGRSLQKMA